MAVPPNHPSVSRLLSILKRYSPDDIASDPSIKDEVRGVLESEMASKQGFSTHDINGVPHYQLESNSYTTSERARNFGLSSLQYYASVAEGCERLERGYYPSEGDLVYYYEAKLEKLLGGWFEENPEKKLHLSQCIQQKMSTSAGEFPKGDLIDNLSLADLFSASKIGEFSLSEAVASACRAAEEANMLQEIKQACDEASNDFYGLKGAVALAEDPDQTNKTFAVISLDGFIDLGQRVGWDAIQDAMDGRPETLDIEVFWAQVAKSHLFNINDIGVPYSGHSGFCEETLKRRFEEVIGKQFDKLPEISRAAPSLDSAKQALAKIMEMEKSAVNNLQADEQELTQGTSRGL